MYSKLVVYRSELNSKAISKYKILGILCELILSKELFKRNSDISIFLKEVLFLEFKEYVFASRASILSRTIREIPKEKEEKYTIYKNNLLNFVIKNIEIIKKEKNIIEKKEKFLDGWIKWK